MTPSKGPPNRPKMLSEICNTVEPTYSHRNDKTTVKSPNMAAKMIFHVKILLTEINRF